MASRFTVLCPDGAAINFFYNTVLKTLRINFNYLQTDNTNKLITILLS